MDILRKQKIACMQEGWGGLKFSIFSLVKLALVIQNKGKVGQPASHMLSIQQVLFIF